MPFFVDVFPSWRFLQIQFAMKQPFCPQRPRRNQSVQSAKAHKVRTSCVHASGQWNWVNFCVNLTTGDGRETTEQLSGPQFPFTTRIVLHLVDQLLGRWTASGYHLYTDQFYTSPTLALELLQRDVHQTGTIQRNRQGMQQ